ncbi:MAG TPA: aminoglycoside phosphotransferase family protein [Rhizomicrobium sp.]|nr:aminoglycoside phosphotransferase family protein [Rhizomicrobium sp.]
MTEAEETIRAALADMGLAGARDDYTLTPLVGGISCDVFMAELPARRAVVKRALPKLRVTADWRAPPERSEAEVAWIKLVAGINPAWVPQVLGEDRTRHVFAMAYLPPAQYPLWKAQLAEGHIDAHFAASVGAALARIHAATAGRTDIAAAFDNRAQFHALRVEPYLLHAAGNNPDVAATIREIANGVESSSIALMQGDISPKNILRGPEGPVFLDAETACYGDPAFDLAFCLNHLLLKGAWHPQYAAALSNAFAALKDAYLKGVSWEDASALDRRTAPLLAALLLARVDGKSPVEYLPDARKRDFVRAQAKAFLQVPTLTLDTIIVRWTEALKTL